MHKMLLLMDDRRGLSFNIYTRVYLRRPITSKQIRVHLRPLRFICFCFPMSQKNVSQNETSANNICFSRLLCYDTHIGILKYYIEMAQKYFRIVKLR